MIYFLPAILLIIIGWLIKYKQVTWLISGYNTASKEKKALYDIDKLCRLMGNFLFILSSIFILMGILSLILSDYQDWVTWLGFILECVIIVLGIAYMNTGNRVKKSQ